MKTTYKRYTPGTDPVTENTDPKSIKKHFNELYDSGGYGYDYMKEKNILADIFTQANEVYFGRTNIPLLDVGSGDGFWSNILSAWFAVTGIDLSKTGIKIARENYPDIEFIMFDFLKWKSKRKFDIVFMRSPSFLNFPADSDEFKTGIKKAISHCSRSLWFIKWVVAPFDRYDDNSYIHDPEKVKKALSQYGECKIYLQGNYFYANLILQK